MSEPTGTTRDARTRARDALGEIGELEASVSNFDGDGDALEMKLNNYIAGLKELHATAPALTRGQDLHYEIPVELLQNLDDGGNPDIFAKTIMRSAVAANQASRGKVEAFRKFHDILLEQLEQALPEEIQEYKALKSTTPPTS